MATATRLMTTEELLAMPDDGIDRELIRGELREDPKTTRGNPQSTALINLGWMLRDWLRRQPRPRGRLQGGETRIRLRRAPDTFVGADLASINAEQAASNPVSALFLDGPPVLTVEILSLSDTVEKLAEKVRAYLDAGVFLVWEVNPFARTVTVHRPDAPPQLFNEVQELLAEPHLPGFRAPVAEVFED